MPTVIASLAPRRFPCPFAMRIAGAEKEVWEHIVHNCTQMYAETCEQAAACGLEAANADGFIVEDGVKKFIDIHVFENIFLCEAVFQNKLFERPLALRSKVGEKLQGLFEQGVEVWKVIKAAICFACPRVAALHRGQIKTEEVLRIVDKVPRNLAAFGCGSQVIDPLVSFISSQIEAVKKSSIAQAKNDVLNTLDMSFGSAPVVMTDTQVNDFLAKLSGALSPHCCALSPHCCQKLNA